MLGARLPIGLNFWPGLWPGLSATCFLSLYATEFEHAEVELLPLSAEVEAAEDLIVLVHCSDGVYRLRKISSVTFELRSDAGGVLVLGSRGFGPGIGRGATLAQMVGYSTSNELRCTGKKHTAPSFQITARWPNALALRKLPM